MKKDYLIVGQGLAGSIVAYRLLQIGKSVAIIDERNPSSSSRVAAGLANPFTGPKMLKSWKAEELFPALKEFYTEIEKETASKFFTERILYRPFGSVEEINDWDGRSSQENYRRFIKSILKKGVHSQYIQEPLGGAEIEAYVLDVDKFLDTLYGYLKTRTVFLEEFFDENEPEIQDQIIKYKDIEASKIIFCSGHQIQKSKYFGWLPLAPVKGEILHLRLKSNFETIYNRSCFIIPQESGIYKAGSTYDRKDLTEFPTESGKNEICKKLDALLKMKYEIVKQESGIRPATVSRRPLMGVHPAYKNVFVFNGLGTKGVSLAPFFSDQFVKFLEEGNNLDTEVDIKKYNSLYFNSHFSVKN